MQRGNMRPQGEIGNNAVIRFSKFVFTPAGSDDVTLAVAACRAGGIGVLNSELGGDHHVIIDKLTFLSEKAGSGYGLKLGFFDDNLLALVIEYKQKGLDWLILDCEIVNADPIRIVELRRHGVKVLGEVKTSCWPGSSLDEVIDGLILKGNEAGGFVGENSSFILVQKWRTQTELPLFVRGGVSPQVAAACSAVGVAGGVLDSQVLLLEESSFARGLRPLLENLSGNETIAVGDGEEGRYFRLLVRPGHRSAQAFYAAGSGKHAEVLKDCVRGKIDWREPSKGLLPFGQDVIFAAPWRKRYGRMSAVFRAIDSAVDNYLPQIIATRPLSENAPLAQALGVSLPLVQGPMSRISDSAEFARAISEGGALPVLALALSKGKALATLLEETAKALGHKSWGVGLLGFAPQTMLDEQLALVRQHRPKLAVIAGGRPDQAAQLEEAGILSFLHVPSPTLLPLFIQEGARRFIFEGRECGGHIGPLSGFVLWSAMIDCLLSELDSGKVAGSEIQVLFAGGIHDAASSAMVQVLAAPLVSSGVEIGFIMGSSYLFTKEIVDTGAIVPAFQKQVIACEQTVILESGPGHASRCAYTPFARSFFCQRQELLEKGAPVDETRKTLDNLIMGRLLIAAKGCARADYDTGLTELDEGSQQREGMYMVGQVATLRFNGTDIAALHHEVTSKANSLLTENRIERKSSETCSGKPVDIAIVGTASLLPKANTTQVFWENILSKVDAITEIPLHRWDWRLYFDEDRQAKDKVYSKWGGFIDDVAFDPGRFGMPPKSIESVDPMQLMALEVAWRTLVDAGYEEREFDRERASVIIGASGGAGDVGMQYGLRAELPRFKGDLPESIAQRLPEWTEDTFAGILQNVMAGRIANRLNFGGVNFTTDAACASSLAAIYQGVNELIAGRSDLVIAGGVDTVQGPFGYLCFSKTQALSPRGRCRTFDVAADGIVISEGIAMVALKRLDDAERDGDRIYAVIKGIGGSSDGKAKGLTAPLPAGQLRAMRRAYEQAGFSPESVGLFEAHGTGTVAGDTAELESTTSLLKEAGCKPKQAVIGSVKTMIGHTKATAGVAGMIKAALALHHRVLPPHFGVSQPIQMLQKPDCPLFLVDEALPWLTPPDKPRRAAVSAFGFGGTNFHVVMEEYTAEYRPWLHPAVSQHWPAELFLWRGNDREGLVAQLTQVQQELGEIASLELRDLAYNLARVWQLGGESLAIVATDPRDLATKIAAALNYLAGTKGALPPGVYGNDSSGIAGKVAVLFPGQGSQYAGMLRELALNFPTLAETISEADELLRGCFAERFGADASLSRFVFPRGAYSEQDKADVAGALTSTDVAQPALGAIEAGLWRMMRLFGLRPDMVGGHSYGEFVALFAAEMIDFEALMSLSEARGRFIVDAAKEAGTELGTMAAIQAAREEVEKEIAGIDDVVIANHNAPQQTIISGSTAAVKEALAKMTQADMTVSEIPVAAAFHSRFVEPAQAALAGLIRKTVWRDCQIPVYANTTGEPHPQDVDRVKQVMTDHLVRPVEFVAQIEAMYRDGARVFLELGPKTVLSRSVSRILEGRPHKAIAIDGNGGGILGMLNAMAQLLCAGINMDVLKLFEGRGCLDCDPAQLTRMQRQEPPGKNVWFLNGSGARRAAEPVKQIGVRIEDLVSNSASTLEAKAPFFPGSQSNSIAPSRLMSRKKEKEEPYMRDRRQTPPDGEPAIMAEFFDMMRQFLETQERIMSMYMGGAAVARRTGQRPMSNPAPAFRGNPEPERIRSPQPGAWPSPPAPPVASAAADAPGEPAAPALPREAVATPQVAAIAAAGAMDGQHGRIDRLKICATVLTIIEEKTGYPPDMVGLDQNLEADLGIDSIKRIEIVGALLKALPPSYGQSLGENRGKLNTQPTLNKMLDLLETLEVEGGASVPFDQAEMGTTTSLDLGGRPFRHVVEPEQESIDSSALKRLEQGHYLITRDSLGVAEELCGLLSCRGCTVSMIEQDVLKDESSLARWRAARGADLGTVAGLVHLAPIGSEWLDAAAPMPLWQSQLQVNEKSLFLLLQQIGRTVADAAVILSVSALGGFFGRRGIECSGLSLQAGAVGLLKSLHEERPQLRVKAVDVDPTQSSRSVANALLSELELVGGRQEVGYPHGQRTIFRTVPALPEEKEERAGLLRNLVVLATGGLRGVTAELVRELALPGNTLLLTGRNGYPEEEPEDIRGLATPAALRQHFISQVRKGHLRLTPAEVQRKVQSLLGAREMRANMEDFRKRGAMVEYFQVDVAEEEAMGRLFELIHARHGALGGVIHGAGVIEDRLLSDKSSESWSRVVETKVVGLLLLQKYLRTDSLRFFTVLSSVAGRYGNSGQTDYATANELMNRLCCQLRHTWGEKVIVKSLCWGPWGETTFGSGMVTEETRAKFAQKGVGLVRAEIGRLAFREELIRGGGDAVEIICGEGPWEEHEAALGRILPATENRFIAPMLDQARITSSPKGEKIIALQLGDNHAYLQEHCLDDVPILPAAAALEIMSEAVGHLWPGWLIVEARDCRLLKGIELSGKNRELTLVVTPPIYGGDGFEVNASIRSESQEGTQRLHYRSTLRLEHQFPVGFEHPLQSHAEKKLSTEKAYAEWLFHGPRFQVIDRIDGLSASGATAWTRTTSPEEWLANVEPAQTRWIFDPALVDAAAQMALLWARVFRDESALPVRFGRVARYRETLPGQLYMNFERIITEEPNTVRANVYFCDAANRVVLLVEDMECISSADLNRLGGTARNAVKLIA